MARRTKSLVEVMSDMVAAKTDTRLRLRRGLWVQHMRPKTAAGTVYRVTIWRDNGVIPSEQETAAVRAALITVLHRRTEAGQPAVETDGIWSLKEYQKMTAWELEYTRTGPVQLQLL